MTTIPSRAHARLRHRLVATRASAHIHQLSHHAAIARHLASEADALAAELERLDAGEELVDRRCETCGCTDDRACWPTCHWIPIAGHDVCSVCWSGLNPEQQLELGEGCRR